MGQIKNIKLHIVTDIKNKMRHICNAAKLLCRRYLRPPGVASFHTNSEQISVLVSKSNCPYENLAFEEYIHGEVKFDEAKRVLFLWRNEPSVVIGRHQNPWLEVNLPLAREREPAVNICRRVSGGGTVYHDLGNINLTFFTHRNLYNRQHNLQFIIDSLSSVFPSLNIAYNDKDDILLDNAFKVSGSAAKLGVKNAFHHCTLLCDTDTNSLKGLLRHSFGKVKTSATKSRPSPIACLFEHVYCFEGLCDLFNDRYKCWYGGSGESSSDIQSIHPLDYPAAGKQVSALKSWDWVYGKTPAFEFPISVVLQGGRTCRINFQVKKGCFHSADVVATGNYLAGDEESLSGLISTLVGKPFNYEDLT